MSKKKILIAAPANGLKIAFDLENSDAFPEKEGSYYIPRKYSKIIKKIEKFGLMVSDLTIQEDGEFSFHFKEKISRQCDWKNLENLESFISKSCKQIKFSKRRGTNNPEYDLTLIFNDMGDYPDRTDKEVLEKFIPLYLHDNIEWDIEKVLYKIDCIRSKKDTHNDTSKKKKKNKK